MCKVKIILFLIWIAIGNCQRVPLPTIELNIGALFYDDESYMERMFMETVDSINSQNEGIFKLLPIVERLDVEDGPLIMERKACELIDGGVAAIFGPSSKTDSDIVSLLCNSTGIPHILFDAIREENEMDRQNHQRTLNVYPSQLIVSKAYSDIVHNFGWQRFTIVYDGDDERAPVRLQDLLQLKALHNDVVRVRKFSRTEDYRLMWKSIKGERRVVLDCPPDILVEVLNASIPFGLTGEFNHLFLTNFETSSGNLGLLKDNSTFQVNVTAARLRYNEPFAKFKEEDRAALYPSDISNGTVPQKILFADLIYDALILYSLTLKNLSRVIDLKPPKMMCEYPNKGESWNEGEHINYMMKVLAPIKNDYFRYMLMQFDSEGTRIDFNIEIYNPMDNRGIASWDTKGHIKKFYGEQSDKKIVYRVATRRGLPYFDINKEKQAANVTGNDLYEGYAVDLIKALGKEMGFEYVFYPVPDDNYGKYNKETKQWDGIIGALVNNDAHIGICDLTITKARKQAVDFTVPFMQLGISILAYQNPIEMKEWNSFLNTFTNEVWIYVMLSVFIIAFLFIFMARISNAEWENPHPCNRDPEVLENKWNVLNSFWLTMGSIMTAGSDILPRSAPMRIFNAMWWIFAIIINNSYTANLAAFLTNSKMEGSITGIDSLTEQTEVKFGTLQGGSTYTFFSDSNDTVYRMAYHMMQGDDPSAYTKSNQEGVDRVLKNNGTYMFLMESTSLEYHTERDCRLGMLGERFGDKHYAIAVPKGAEYRMNLSVALLRLSERGQLFKLKEAWWKNTNNSCPRFNEGQSDTNDLNFSEVRGIFYTLGVGILLAYILGITEFLIYCQEVAVEEKLTFKEAFLKELKFVMQIWNNKKPVNTPSASTRSSSRISGGTEKSSQSTKSSNQKNTSTEEMQERKSIRSLKNFIKNLRDHKM